MKRLFSLKVVLAFLVVFLIGGVVGGLVIFNLADLRFSKFLNRANDPASMALRINQKLVSEYNLTEDQQKNIAPLTREMAEKMHQLRRQFGEGVVATMDSYHQKVAEQMAPAQREGYEKMNIERHQRAVDTLLPERVSANSERK